MEGIRIVDLIFLGFCFVLFCFSFLVFSSLLFLELLEKHPFLEESPINLFWVLGHESYDPAFIHPSIKGSGVADYSANFLTIHYIRTKSSGDDDHSSVIN
jgi:hypothetical protein